MCFAGCEQNNNLLKVKSRRACSKKQQQTKLYSVFLTNQILFFFKQKGWGVGIASFHLFLDKHQELMKPFHSLEYTAKWWNWPKQAQSLFASPRERTMTTIQHGKMSAFDQAVVPLKSVFFNRCVRSCQVCREKLSNFIEVVSAKYIPLWRDCTLRGMWACFSLSIPPRTSALCASKQAQVSHWLRGKHLTGDVAVIREKIVDWMLLDFFHVKNV